MKHHYDITATIKLSVTSAQEFDEPNRLMLLSDILSGGPSDTARINHVESITITQLKEY